MYHDNTRHKPLFRGWIHLLMCSTSILWIIPMLQICDTYDEMLSVYLFWFSCIFCYGSSALYHCGKWTKRTECIFAIADIIGIFIMITYTSAPIILLLVDNGALILNVMHFICFAIIIYCLYASYISTADIFYHRITRSYKKVLLVYVVYSVTLTAFIRPQFFSKTSIVEQIYWYLGILSYTIGTIIYAKQYPDPWPHIFGYHEIFHLCCVISLIFTYLLNYNVIKLNA